MLKELRFVQGAVAKKELVASMTHFRIQGGHVRSYNGLLAISSPIALDIDCCPKADAMVRAISNCTESTTISLTPSLNRLSVRSGRFRAYVPTIDGPTPHVDPAGNFVTFDGAALLDALRAVEPFIGTDASRPWAGGALLKDSSVFATNNTCVVQQWVGTPFPRTISLPRAAVLELLRVGDAPTHGQIDERSMTFHYADGRWIRTQLLDIEGWPHDRIAKVLDTPSRPVPLPTEFFTGLNVLRGLVDGASRVYMRDGALRTHENGEDGAIYEVDIPSEGLYNMKMLSLLEGVVTHADFTKYPEPALFFGGRLRGAIVGMRM